jgi:hypothetical protein
MSTFPDSVNGRSRIVGLWTQLFGLVLWFGATYGQFLNFDLELAANTHHAGVVVGLGALVSAVVIALALNAPAVFRSATEIRFWYFSSAILVMALVALVFLYRELYYTWTCNGGTGSSLLMGSKATPWLLDFLAKGGIKCTAFEQFPGNSEALYEVGSIWSRYQILASVYIVAWAILSALIISVANSFKVRKSLK